MWSQWNFHCGAEEKITTRQISGEWGMDFFLEVFREGRLDFQALTKVHYTMYFEIQNFSLGGGFEVDDEGDDEDHRCVKSGIESSQCVYVELTCV